MCLASISIEFTSARGESLLSTRKNEHKGAPCEALLDWAEFLLDKPVFLTPYMTS